jgi:hypothetical protein
MGLDQYCYAVRDTGDLPDIGYTHPRIAEDAPEDVVKLYLLDNPRFPVMYWRKHPNLHGWMERLYRSRGGDGDFNCVSVRLHREDLSELIDDLRNDRLPATSGFFFGHSDPSMKAEDAAFVSRAMDILDHGWALYYDSWW